LIRLEITTLVESLEPLIRDHERLVEEIKSGDTDRAAAACWALFRDTSRLLTQGMASGVEDRDG
jgi:DNA-binding GntR family transcriptional regulator